MKKEWLIVAEHPTSRNLVANTIRRIGINTLANNTIKKIRMPSFRISALFAFAVFWVKNFLRIFLISTRMIVPMDEIQPRTEKPMNG